MNLAGADDWFSSLDKRWLKDKRRLIFIPDAALFAEFAKRGYFEPLGYYGQ